MAATIKVIELIGVSAQSWDEAVRAAVTEACRTIRNVHGIDVLNQTAKVRDGRIYEYHANVKIAFVVEDMSAK